MSNRLIEAVQGAISIAEMDEFKPVTTAFVHQPLDSGEVFIVNLLQIKSFERGPGVVEIDPDRAASILEAIKSSDPLPPIEVLPARPDLSGSFEFELYNGFHRFHLSKALGFTHIPAIVRPRESAWPF